MGLGLVVLLQAVALAFFVRFRLIDGDTGIFLHAARMVRHGAVPYHDFFYMQMPYQAYLLAPFATEGFAGLFMARTLAATASLLMTAGLGLTAYRVTRDAVASTAAAFLFGLNALTLVWHSVPKTTVTSDFFGVAAMISFITWATHPAGRRRWLVIAGAAIGLAAGFRLTHVLLLPGAAAFVWYWSPSSREAVCALGALALGAVAASVGSIVLFALGPHAFLFHNLVFRQVWAGAVVQMPWDVRVLTVAKFVFYPANLLLIVLAGLGLYRVCTQAVPLALRRAAVTGAVFGGTLMLFYVVVTPTMLQYFGQTLPYLVMAGLPALAALPLRWRRRGVLVGVGAAYAALIAPFAIVFLLAVRDRDRRFDLENTRALVTTIHACTTPDEVMLSTSPHLPVLAQRPAVQGLEVQGLSVVEHLTPAQRERALLLSLDDLVRVLQDEQPALVAFDRGMPGRAEDVLEQIYVPVDSVPGLTLYAHPRLLCAASS